MLIVSFSIQIHERDPTKNMTIVVFSAVKSYSWTPGYFLVHIQIILKMGNTPSLQFVSQKPNLV